MAKAEHSITPHTSLETILEECPGAKDVLVRYFGAGITLSGQTWLAETLSRACLIRGVDERKLLADLRKAVKE